jgi:hypothetical protein
VDGTLRPSSQGKLALTKEITRLLDEKEKRVKEIHRLPKEQEQLGKGNLSKSFDPT